VPGEIQGPVLADAQTILAMGGAREFSTRLIVFQFASAAIQTFVVPGDGFIFGISGTTTQYAVSVNIQPPSNVTESRRDGASLF